LSAAGSVCGCLSRLRVRRREPGALTLPTPSSIPPDYATQEGETRFNAAQRLFDTTRLAAVSCYFPETVMKLSGTAGVRGVIIKRGQHVRNWIGHCDFPLKESDRSCLEPGWNLDETPLSGESASRLQLQPLPHLTHLLAQRLQLGKPRHARLLRLAARATVHACVLHVLLQRGNLLVEQRKAGE